VRIGGKSVLRSGSDSAHKYSWEWYKMVDKDKCPLLVQWSASPGVCIRN